MRVWLVLLAVLLAGPAWADMYPNASNAVLPAARTNLGLGSTNIPDFAGLALYGANVNPAVHPPGTRGPLFIWNNPSTNLAGENDGLQVWIGDNPTGTPGAGDAIAGTFYVDNLNGRTATWALNIICAQAAAAAGGGAGIGHCIEINPYANFAVAAPTDPFTSGPSVQGIEIVPTQGAGVSVQDAIKIFGPTTTITDWPNHGVALARVNFTGFSCQTVAGDPNPDFTIACFVDNSHSQRVFKIGGEHGNIFDLTSLINLSGPFIHLPQTYASNLLITNLSDFGVVMTLDSGSSAAQDSGIILSSKGAPKWEMLKNNADDFVVVNKALASNSIFIAHATDVVTLGAPAYANCTTLKTVAGVLTCVP